MKPKPKPTKLTVELYDGELQSLLLLADAMNLTAEDCIREIILKRLQQRANRVSDELDWIRERVSEKAAAQGLSAYAISQTLDGYPTKEAVRRYLDRKCHLGTQHVSKLCNVLGLELRSIDQ